jgi:hypothetical protein
MRSLGLLIQAGANASLKLGGNASLEAGANASIKGGASASLEGGGLANVKGSVVMLSGSGLPNARVGDVVQVNGPFGAEFGTIIGPGNPTVLG